VQQEQEQEESAGCRRNPPDAYDLEEAARRLDLAYKKKGEN